MTSPRDVTNSRVIKIVQELLVAEGDRASITPALIDENINKVLTMSPSWRESLDREAVIDELIRRFSLWIGKDTAIKSDVGHEPWLAAGTKANWAYWQRYSEWLEQKLSWAAIDGLNHSTDAVLGLLEDPTRGGRWSRRGLVVGHVQSGKTANYTGLICKAADAGYKILVVLAGLHNNLRTQTQMRLEEGFLGYETSAAADHLGLIGVGLVNSDKDIHPNCATNRSDKGDFNTSISRRLAITPEQRPWLFVVKKNKTVLERLHRWITHHVANTKDSETGRSIVTNLPLLVVDDESDHASVDTGAQSFDSDGKPDEEHSPKAINSLIRKILHSFTRSAYVGYTATPFANIFIHQRGETREEGPDLFPSAFIRHLGAPSDYVGPARIFGVADHQGRRGGLPLVREIADYQSDDGDSGWMPQQHGIDHAPRHCGLDAPPPSLIEAIHAFFLCCAARQLRGQGSDHSSMLVHVTRYNSVQGEVHRQVQEYVRQVRQRLDRGIDDQVLLETLRSLWVEDFEKTSAEVRLLAPDQRESATLDWGQISAALPSVVSSIEVRMINGTAKDVLDYSQQLRSGLKVIAIGGDKLARGLTLEGLCVSYFLRASKMYDTLMQMGRWFGYRPGYLDLSRLYTTSELVEWFAHITDAGEELREEFDHMAAAGASPIEYGLKVQSHSVLMVTSQLKMRAARNLMLSFSGQLLETVTFYRDAAKLQANLNAAKRFIELLRDPEVDPHRLRTGSGEQNWEGFLWKDVPASHVIEFLSSYTTHPTAYKVNSLLIGEFIERLAAEGELTRWSVALIGGGKGGAHDIADGIGVTMLKRSRNNAHEDRYSIGRLLSSRDEAIAIDDRTWVAALDDTVKAWSADPARAKGRELPDQPGGVSIRKIRGFGAEGIPPRPDEGLLLLYLLDPQEADPGWRSEDVPPVVAFGVSFPGSNSGVKVEYKVNNVLWEQEYGAAD